GQAVGHLVLAAGDGAEQRAALILTARQDDRDGAEPADQRDERAPRRDARDLLDHDGDGERPPTDASELLRVADRHEVALDEDFVDVPGELVLVIDLRGAGEADALLGDLPDDGPELLQLLRQLERMVAHGVLTLRRVRRSP